jgi:hypothetical protein
MNKMLRIGAVSLLRYGITDAVKFVDIALFTRQVTQGSGFETAGVAPGLLDWPSCPLEDIYSA